MKPLRGSNREASEAPTTTGKSKKKDEPTQQNKAKKKQTQTVKDKTSETSTRPQKTLKRKASSSQPQRLQGQDWKQMPGSAVVELGKILDLSLLATLAQKQSNKNEVQEHLNTVKKRFLEHCSTLKVPGYKQKQESAAHLHEETKKSEAEKQTLNALKENLKAVVNSLEKNEEEMNVLEHQCSVLRSRVQDQMDESEEVFPKSEAVLNLPPLRPAVDETTLEDKMRGAVPDSEAETMARKLGEILQSSEILQDAQELLSLAHRHMDELFHLQPPTLPLL